MPPSPCPAPAPHLEPNVECLVEAVLGGQQLARHLEQAAQAVEAGRRVQVLQALVLRGLGGGGSRV